MEILCRVQSDFGGDWDDGAEDPLDDIRSYAHKVHLAAASDGDLSWVREEAEYEQSLINHRAEMDAFRRAGERVRFCEVTQARFAGDLDRVLKAVQCLEFSDENRPHAYHAFGDVIVDGEIVHFVI